MAWLSTTSACTCWLSIRSVQQCRAPIRVTQPCRWTIYHARRQAARHAGEGAPASTAQTAATQTPVTAGPAGSQAAPATPVQATPVKAQPSAASPGSTAPAGASVAAPQAAPAQAAPTKPSQQGTAQGAPSSQPPTPEQQKHKNAISALDQRFREAYTMSQVYVKDRPAPIPLSEYEKRRKTRELEEITAAGKRRGVSAETIKANLEQVESLLPGLVNLHKAKAADWVTIIKDVNVLMTKVLIIKDTFPQANLHKIVTSQPKLLLKSEADLKQDGQKVRTILAAAPDAVDMIIETVPDLINPVSLVRSLSYIKSSFGGVDPVELIAKHPDVLLNMGEASIEDSAEYGWAINDEAALGFGQKPMFA